MERTCPLMSKYRCVMTPASHGVKRAVSVLAKDDQRVKHRLVVATSPAGLFPGEGMRHFGHKKMVHERRVHDQRASCTTI